MNAHRPVRIGVQIQPKHALGATLFTVGVGGPNDEVGRLADWPAW